MNDRIFIVDDDPEIALMARKTLETDAYVVSHDANPVSALRAIKSSPPDLVLLDINMKEMNGLDVCRELKSDPRTSGIPIVMISVMAEEADVVAGLEIGAEDYIAKPLRRRELLARVRAVLRRRRSERSPILECGPFRVDFGAYRCWADGQALALTPKEFELLGLFIRKEGRVLTRGMIGEAIWGADLAKSSRTVDTHVDQLRRKLGLRRGWIQSLKGIGYRFEVAEEA